MKNNIGIAIGAGLASALLFVVSAKGTTATALIAYFTALPIMIAALSFGHLPALAGGLLASGGIAVMLGPMLAAFFAVCFAVPGWWLGYLSLLARPAPAPAAGGDPLLWYPVNRIVLWAVGLGVGAVAVLGTLVLVRYGGYEAVVEALARRLEQAAGEGSTTHATATVFIRILPVAMAASLFLMLILNLWLAARVARLSERLRRPWPNVPDGYRLPKGAGAALLLVLLPSALGGVAGTAAGALAAALGLAFALQGLAAAHVLTRGFAGRGLILGLIYVVTLALPVAVAALGLLGLIDCFFSLRVRRKPPSTPLQKPGV